MHRDSTISLSAFFQLQGEAEREIDWFEDIYEGLYMCSIILPCPLGLLGRMYAELIDTYPDSNLHPEQPGEREETRYTILTRLYQPLNQSIMYIHTNVINSRVKS